MLRRKRLYWIQAVVAMMVVMAMVATLGFGPLDDEGDEGPEGPPGQIDDGAERLPEATITLEAAIAAAQAAFDGELGEVDLEDYKGRLVFNIDIGPQDVKVDAGDGTVLGSESDDKNDGKN